MSPRSMTVPDSVPKVTNLTSPASLMVCDIVSFLQPARYQPRSHVVLEFLTSHQYMDVFGTSFALFLLGEIESPFCLSLPDTSSQDLTDPAPSFWNILPLPPVVASAALPDLRGCPVMIPHLRTSAAAHQSSLPSREPLASPPAESHAAVHTGDSALQV